MKTLITEKQIQDIEAIDVPDLLEKMPVNGYAEGKFTPVGISWAYNFTFASPAAHFAAHGTGEDPRAAFESAKTVLMGQIGDWHRMREGEFDYFPRNEDGKNHKPIVMIVDDDIDTALATEKIFQQLGCETQVVTDPYVMSRKISFGDADFIILDWKLDQHTEGSDILKRAARMIDSFTDLKARFGRHQPKVITHSVLKGSEIDMPRSRYFQHMDHWQKPLRFDQLVQRGGAVLNACGF
jgi:CheY-like chemotaxis protein